MMQKSELLHKINDFINTNDQQINQLGILTGLSGICLYKYIYAKSSNDAKMEVSADKTLQQCLSILNTTPSDFSFTNGISGFGWLLEYLKENNLIISNNDEILPYFDDNVYLNMEKHLKDGNYDFFYGGIGAAYYFHKRYLNTESTILKAKYKKILKKFIKLIDDISIKEDSSCTKWSANIINQNTNTSKYNFGLSHGIPGILSVLIKISETREFLESTQSIIEGGINYLLKFKSKDNSIFSYFPYWANSKNSKSRLAWCYGDLGVAYTILRYGYLLNNQDLIKQSLEVLYHSCKRKSRSNTYIETPWFCHGAYGVSHMYTNIYKITLDKTFLASSKYWANIGNKLIMDNKLFTPTKNINKQLSIIDGMSGVGLSILSQTNLNVSNWDECLQIN